jgi:DNA-binding MarR family transcriptional regulator
MLTKQYPSFVLKYFFASLILVFGILLLTNKMEFRIISMLISQLLAKRSINMLSRFERFSYSLLSIYKSWSKLTGNVMENYGLKGTYAIYLLSIADHEEGITAAQLSDLCSRDKADVSRAVADMEQKGFIIKSGNRYRAQLILTDKGQALAEQLNSHADMAVNLAGASLSEEQRQCLYLCLETIAGRLQALDDEGLPNI